jgi:hypothetical protein
MLKYTERDRGRDRQTDRLFEKKSILPALLEQVMRMQRKRFLMTTPRTAH